PAAVGVVRRPCQLDVCGVVRRHDDVVGRAVGQAADRGVARAAPGVDDWLPGGEAAVAADVDGVGRGADLRGRVEGGGVRREVGGLARGRGGGEAGGDGGVAARVHGGVVDVGGDLVGGGGVPVDDVGVGGVEAAADEVVGERRAHRGPAGRDGDAAGHRD